LHPLALQVDEAQVPSRLVAPSANMLKQGPCAG
jgi:hypothetical protein